MPLFERNPRITNRQHEQTRLVQFLNRRLRPDTAVTEQRQKETIAVETTLQACGISESAEQRKGLDLISLPVTIHTKEGLPGESVYWATFPACDGKQILELFTASTAHPTQELDPYGALGDWNPMLREYHYFKEAGENVAAYKAIRTGQFANVVIDHLNSPVPQIKQAFRQLLQRLERYANEVDFVKLAGNKVVPVAMESCAVPLSRILTASEAMYDEYLYRSHGPFNAYNEFAAYFPPTPHGQPSESLDEKRQALVTYIASLDARQKEEFIKRIFCKVTRGAVLDVENRTVLYSTISDSYLRVTNHTADQVSLSAGHRDFTFAIAASDTVGEYTLMPQSVVFDEFKKTMPVVQLSPVLAWKTVTNAGKTNRVFLTDTEYSELQLPESTDSLLGIAVAAALQQTFHSPEQMALKPGGKDNKIEAQQLPTFLLMPQRQAAIMTGASQLFSALEQKVAMR